MFIYLDCKKKTRSIQLPYPLSYAGITCRQPTRFSTQHYGENTEFCFRISSDEKEAVDLINGTEYRTTYPHFILKRSGDFHTIGLPDSLTRSGLLLGYGPSAFDALKKAGLVPDQTIFPIHYSETLSELAEKWRNALEHSMEPFTADRLDLIALNLLEELHFLSRKMPEDPEKIRILDAAAKMRRFPGDVNVEKIATESGFSKRNFYRVWQKYFSGTPAQFILEIRLNHAAYLLQNTGLTVSDIAYRLNFSSDNYFSTSFRRKFGKTPSDYRSGQSNSR